jgi:hypothetical protein
LETSGLSHAFSFDHLVGAGEEIRGDGEAEHGDLCVDNQLELVRLNDRQVRRLLALEDATSIDADLTVRVISFPGDIRALGLEGALLTTRAQSAADATPIRQRVPNAYSS